MSNAETIKALTVKSTGTKLARLLAAPLIQRINPLAVEQHKADGPFMLSVQPGNGSLQDEITGDKAKFFYFILLVIRISFKLKNIFEYNLIGLPIGGRNIPRGIFG